VERRQQPEGVGQAEEHARGDGSQAAEEEHGVPFLRDAQGDGDAGLEERRSDGAGCCCPYSWAAPGAGPGEGGVRGVGGMVEGGRGRGCSGAPGGAGLGAGALRRVGAGVGVGAVGAVSATRIIRPRLVRGGLRAVVHQRQFSSSMEHGIGCCSGG
jgi:hypothetical protein